MASLQLERSFLAGLLKFQLSLLSEVDSFFSNDDITNTLHSSLYTIGRRILLNGEKLDKVIWAEKLIQLGISFKDAISPHDYIDNLSCSQINLEGSINTARELVKLRVRRELCKNAEDVKKYVLENGDKSISEIISGTDSIYNNKITQYQEDDEPVDIYSKIEPFLKDIAKNPVQEVGLITPFEQWNRLFGGLRPKSAAINIVSRAAEGKSCFIFNMMKGVCRLNKCKGILIDTEMDVDLQMFRAGAAEAGINAWMLETGNWARNVEMSAKVMGSFKKFDEMKGSIYHKYAPNKNIHEILALIRKWVYKYVGRGNPFVIGYDYLKITSLLEKNRAEHQALGDSISYLNELNHDLGGVLLTAAQQSRAGEQQGGSVRYDDSTTVAASDRINQYASFNAVFRRKTLEEQADQGISFGTHLLKPFKYGRVQGKDNYHNNNLVRVVDPHNNKIQYRQNFINYEISDYQITEKGTYADIINHHTFSAKIQDKKDNIDDGNVNI